MKLKQNNLRIKQSAPRSVPAHLAAPLIALGFLAMSGSVTSAFANIPVESNININTANWSTNAGFGSTALGWYKQSDSVDPDVIHLQGAVKQTSPSGSAANLIGTLPPAASPSRVVYAVIHTYGGTYADVAIEPNGQIWLIDPRPPAVKDYSFVSLESVTYEQVLPVYNPINLTTFWSPNAGYGSAAPGYYMDGSFDVHLHGAVAQTSSAASNTLGTVPGGNGPQNRVVYTIVHTFGGTYADVGISPSGQISLIDPRPPMIKDYSFVSLETVTYGNNLLNPITPNSANWSFTPGFGAIAPAWYKDAAGIVHLVGAAKQINAGGASANLVGTLPTAARPNRTVYTIVHTFNGTYADVAISHNGQITLINPREPAVKDFSFVSLESITFQQ